MYYGNLLSKNEMFTVPTHSHRKIEFILSYTRTAVKNEDEFSEMWRILRGVMQGGVLSAFFFSLHVEVLDQAVANEECDC